MNSKYTVEQSEIILYPSELNDIHKNIDTKLRKRIGSCTKENGYIIDIHEIYHDKTTNKISRVSGNCIFTISYKMTTLKPEAGHVYKAIVNCIFKEGIFCEYNNIKILIPISEIKNYTFQNSKFINKSKSIEISNIIQVHINIVRYEDQNYQCIGRMIED